MPDPTTPAAIADRYEAIAYDALPVAVSHPDHVSAVIAMFGLAPPPVATARVLEVGCNDGANLLPMAAALPRATFVGCDIAPAAIRRARDGASALGLANVAFVPGDLATLALGPFDYIIAHGVYSWVGAPVRDALLALAARVLAPNGVAFVSYNTYPGGHLRRAATEPLLWHVRDIADPRERLAAARALATLLAEGGSAQEPADGALRAEWRRIAGESDSALYHDALGTPNDPVWFHEFAAHAERHGLAYVAEAMPWMMAGGGLPPQVRQFLSAQPGLAREQMLDLFRVRRLRQSLLCRADVAAPAALAPAHAHGLHASASLPLLRAAAESRWPAAPDPEGPILRALLETLVGFAPEALPVPEVLRRVAAGAVPGVKPADAILLDGWAAGLVQLHTAPPAVNRRVDPAPLASPVARWQVTRQESVTNLRHEAVRLADPFARSLLPLCDGTRDAAALARAVAGPAGAPDQALAARVEEQLALFARFALLCRR